MNIYFVAWISFVGVLSLIVGVDLLREDRSYLKRYFKINSLTGFAWQDFVERIGPAIAVLLPIYNIEYLEQRLKWAGNPYGLTAHGFIGSKAGLAVGGILFGIFIATLEIPFMFGLMLAVLLYFLPDGLIRGEIEKRQKAIYRSLPNMIGLLATAIAAGVELRPAFEAISKKIPPPLGDELRLAWREMATGKARSQAFRDLGKRTGVPAVERFFETIITAEERGGVDLSIIIETFKKDLLSAQHRKMQEAAKKIPTKMLLPLTLCIFIPLVLLMLIPIGVSLLTTL